MKSNTRPYRKRASCEEICQKRGTFCICEKRVFLSKRQFPQSSVLLECYLQEIIAAYKQITLIVEFHVDRRELEMMLQFGFHLSDTYRVC